MRIDELLIYREFEQGGLLRDMAGLMVDYRERPDKDLFYDCMHRLMKFAASHGFYGNIWHVFLANLLVNNENGYSMACEIRGGITGTINQLALHDIRIFKELYDYDFTDMVRVMAAPEFGLLLDYESGAQESRIYNTRIRDRICSLAEKFNNDATAEDMKDTLTEFYKDYGVGRFGLHKAFRVRNSGGRTVVEPIVNISHVYMDDLVGYEIPKQKLIDNTEAFVGGRKANNCLLFGDAGTGKSSCVKAIANEYYDKGLRIIEIYRHQFQMINDVIAQIKNRNYKFILYMDDLSFENFETEYKYLKAVIEGGLEKKPGNVLIYATSNRRHIVRENFSDKEDVRDDLHSGDTVQEKLSLALRFGVTIFFSSPDKKQFEQIVKTLAVRNGITMEDEELFAQANKWELAHGGLSGRTAQQFIDYLLGHG